MTLQDTEIGSALRSNLPGWTDERVDILRKLHAQNLSFSRIAAYLGGVSRNAVIGKAHRLGLFGQYVAPKKADTRGTLAPAKTKRKRVVIRPGRTSTYGGEVCIVEDEITDLAPDTSEFACTIAGLGSVVDRNQCRFPLGEVSADMQYCGAPCVGSWCARHRNIVFSRPERRER